MKVLKVEPIGFVFFESTSKVKSDEVWWYSRKDLG
jgi:hypothetical protein